MKEFVHDTKKSLRDKKKGCWDARKVQQITTTVPLAAAGTGNHANKRGHRRHDRTTR